MTCWSHLLTTTHFLAYLDRDLLQKWGVPVWTTSMVASIISTNLQKYHQHSFSTLSISIVKLMPFVQSRPLAQLARMSSWNSTWILFHFSLICLQLFLARKKHSLSSIKSSTTLTSWNRKAGASHRAQVHYDTDNIHPCVYTCIPTKQAKWTMYDLRIP